MLIIQAESLGMCFGVKDALEIAHSLKDPQEVAILGEIVHNAQVQGELLSKGFASQSESQRKELPPHPAVMITAHGISERYRERLQHAGKEIIDTTCPLVSRLHKMARHLSQQGYRLVLVGKANHVEVLGITEDFPNTVVLGHPQEACPGLGDKLAILAQTTTPPGLFESAWEKIQELHPQAEVRKVDSICKPTRDRQQAIAKLLDRVEALVVVGGENSNNSLRLLEQAHFRGLPGWRVSDPTELKPEWFSALRLVGLTAGTSTPEDSIQAVYRRLLEIARLRASESAA